MVRRTRGAGEKVSSPATHRGVDMKRLVVFTAAALLAAIPAAAGLAGNSSLSPSVPVDPPTQAVVDDNGGQVDRDARTEPGDDRDVQGATATPTPDPSPSDDPTPTPSPS